MGTLNVANLNHTGDTFTTNANLKFGGSWVDAPIGTIIKRGSYNTGYGSGSRIQTSSQSWNTLNINGTNQAGMNIGKFSDSVEGITDDGLTFSKISAKSHLEISINFPYYLQNGNNGFGIRCQASNDGGGNYVVLGNLENGPAHTWGAGGYGGNDAGVLHFTFSTYDNSTERSSWLARTGEVRFYFQTRVFNTNDTLTMIDYSDTYPKEGTIQVSEIITQ